MMGGDPVADGGEQAAGRRERQSMMLVRPSFEGEGR